MQKKVSVFLILEDERRQKVSCFAFPLYTLTHLVGPEREGCSGFGWLPSPPSCYWEAVWVAELVEDCSLLSPPLPLQLAAGEGWALVGAPLGVAGTADQLTMAPHNWCSCTFLQPAVFLQQP